MGRLVRELVSPRSYLRILYLLLALPLGIAEFTLLATVIPLGLGTAITLLGVPLLLGALYGSRLVADGERWLIGRLLGTPIASPYRKPPESSWWADVRTRLADPATWKDLAFQLLQLPVGIAAFVIVVVVLSAGAWGLAAPVWSATGVDAGPFDSWPVAIAAVPLGAVILVVGIPALSQLGRVYGFYANLLLGSNEDPEVTAEMTELRDARARVIAAADAERRRLERDLHDGAQQRLVSLALTLRMAEKRAAEGDAKAAELVRQAGDEAGMALTELRDLARGLHPAILTNRGLAAALDDLAARAAVPVTIEAVPAERLRDPVEAAAYFVVSECLANVGKHAQASEATVSATVDAGVLTVQVADDGVGGAACNGGSGLLGLEDRVRAVGGTLQVESPPGRGTRVRARIPVAIAPPPPEHAHTRPLKSPPAILPDAEADAARAQRMRAAWLLAVAAAGAGAVVVAVWALTGSDAFWAGWPLLGLAAVAALALWGAHAGAPIRASEVGSGDVRALAARRHLTHEAGAMGLVNATVVGVWALAGGGYFWPAWVFLGTGVAIGLKALAIATRRGRAQAS